MTQKYQGYLIDLDGTMYKGETPIAAAGRFIERLRELDLPFLFVTNNSTASQEQVAAKLKRLNVQAETQEIYTSSLAAADYMYHQGGRSAYVIGEEGLVESVKKVGIKITEDNPDYVVLGLDRQVTYKKFEIATLAIRNGAKFVVTNPDTNLPTEHGLVPGAGSLAALLKAATRVEPVVIGKPNQVIMDEALNRIGLDKDQVIMVGDNYETDILAGIQNGIDTLIVYSGFSTKEEVAKMDQQPTHQVDSLDEWRFDHG